MPHSENAARTAKILLDIKAVLFNTEKPFILTSGRAAPVYVDCRRVISFPEARRAVTKMLGEQIRAVAGTQPFDAVAGAETVGIAYAAWLAEEFDLPMLYVRKQPKGFGARSQIEGELKEGQRVLLVEDVVNYGGSIDKFITALRGAGAKVEHVAVLFNYGILPEVAAKIEALNVKLHYLCTWPDMLAYMRSVQYLPAAQLDSIESFLANPKAWSLAHGGKEETAA